jgi:hypothetical protein
LPQWERSSRVASQPGSTPPARQRPCSFSSSTGMITAGHRNRGRCRRRRHSGVLYLSPVPEHFGTGMGTLITVPDWFRHPHFFSFRYRTDWMPEVGDILPFKKVVHPACPYCWLWKWIHPALHVHRQLLIVLFLLYDIEKANVLPECRRKFSPTSAFLLVDSCLNLASAFRHQGSVRYR